MLEQWYEKLITDEDPYHIHKSMGIYCLLNFVFQLVYYMCYREMILNWMVMIPHVMLHMTSFIFKVLDKRPVTNDNKIISKMSMFIWEELRLHSMIFGLRSCLIIMFPSITNGRIIVFSTLGLADLITYVYGNTEVTTVRGNNKIEKRSCIKKIYAMFFTTSQMGATIICGGFFQKTINPVLVFCTLPAIQTSAFGMTLLRKNMISKTTWQIVYSMELALVYYVWYCEYNNFDILIYSLIAYVMRSNELNKYMLWVIFLLVDDHYRNKTIQKALIDFCILFVSSSMI
jgi:hypothetical protein